MIRNDIFISGTTAKELDMAAMEYGISELQLMRNAAHAVYAELIQLPDFCHSPVIICGKGNNGGDGYALAELLLDNGYMPKVIFCETPRGASSASFLASFLEKGGTVFDFSTNPDDCAGIITSAAFLIDAVFGFSFNGQLTGDYKLIIELANSSEGFVASIDLPSGVYANGGYAQNCLYADMTFTFSANKTATATYPTLEFCGEVVICDIGVPEKAFLGIKTEGSLLCPNVLSFLPKRDNNSNKSTFGTLLSICGSANMPGAAYLSSLGALRSGIGLLKITSDKETISVLKNKLAEPVFVPFIREILAEQKYNALLVGCGIGKTYDNILGEILTLQKQITIIDADGINYLASHINVLTEMQGDVILTPHPGEMARLIGATVEYVNQNRIECAKAFAMEFGCVLVLKGNHTIIASPNGQIAICPTGNNALAKGGSGDVLAGVVASLAAQGVSPYKAACVGVYVHGLAADKLKDVYGTHGLLPHDLPVEIGRLLG